MNWPMELAYYWPVPKNKGLGYLLIGKSSKKFFRIPCSQKIFKITKNDKKSIFQKKSQNQFFFRVLTFFIEKHGKR